MKKFVVNCDVGGQLSPQTIFVGEPEKDHHPLHFQADFLGKERGSNIPSDVMDAIGKLHEIAKKNKVSLEELCVYALGAANEKILENEAGSDGNEGSDKDEGDFDDEGDFEDEEDDDDFDFDDDDFDFDDEEDNKKD